MDLMSFFRAKKSETASTARDRLMVAVAVQRGQDGRNSRGHNFLPALQQEILAVVRKYVQVPDTAVNVKVQHEDGLEMLELNVALPDAKAA